MTTKMMRKGLLVLALTTLTANGMFTQKLKPAAQSTKNSLLSQNRRLSFVPSKILPGTLCLMDKEFTERDLKGARYIVLHNSEQFDAPVIIKYGPLSIKETGFSLVRKDGDNPVIIGKHYVGEKWTYKKVQMYDEKTLYEQMKK